VTSSDRKLTAHARGYHGIDRTATIVTDVKLKWAQVAATSYTEVAMAFARLLLALTLAGAVLSAQRNGRAPDDGAKARPPEDLPCSRNELTSFTGKVTSYERTPTRIRLGIRTDWDTDERLVLTLSSGENGLKGILLERKPLHESDWPVVESAPGKLKHGMRATVWVCEGVANPVLDWQPPPDTSTAKP
jgi:hypothetical protein